MDVYGKVHLDINIMFVNNCNYFTAILQYVGLIQYYAIASHVNRRVVNAMMHTIEQYNKSVFTVCLVHGDNEFIPLDEWFTDKKITLMTCDMNTHVPTIEHTNRFLKE